MISPPRLPTADAASRRAPPPEETTIPPSDSCLVRRGPREEKDPGSAFGPESVPLATGSVPVVYWVPGPFPGPTPVQPDERGKPFCPSQYHTWPRGGWLRAPLPWHSPDLIRPAGPASEPVLD